jgi:ABC-type uncharacterized transport system ATPase subunit
MRLETGGGFATEAQATDPRDGRPTVAMRGITKRFSHVVANEAVNFDVRPGEIHALLGENGAGKTTLMNILSGFLRADGGTIEVRGQAAHIRSPIDAINLGIGMVHQHSALVPTLTVAENMLIGQRGAFVIKRSDISDVAGQLSALGKQHGLEVSPDAHVWQLSVGERQRAEILRALMRNASILILDEPTASLTPTEVDPVLEKLRTMAASGASVVIITHHLDEVMACADRVTVLRQGRNVATLDASATNTRELARLMVGTDVSLTSLVTGAAEPDDDGHAAAQEQAEPIFEVHDLTAEGDRGVTALEDVTFSLAPGEILAIAGVEGNGQTELEEVLFGLRRASAGEVILGGADVTTRPAFERMELGLGFIPSDRFRRGLVRALSIANNLVLDRIDQEPFGSRVRISPRAILDEARTLIKRFSIHASSPTQAAGTLSGGNSQRVVLARALSGELNVLLAAQPTRGLDVAALKFVWDQLEAQRRRGVAILLISTDLEEVFALADRSYVMYRGRLVGPWTRDRFDREEFGLALGGAGFRQGANGAGATGAGAMGKAPSPPIAATAAEAEV